MGARAAGRRADGRGPAGPGAPGGGLPPQTIDLVRRSWAAVMPISDAAASLFYERLFELDPSVRPLFKGDMREQKKKLMQTLAVAVDGLSNLERLVPVLQSLGVRHAGYMVQERHYDLVGQSLLWTLREGLGNAFTPDVEAAWVSVYGLIADTMKRAAAHQAAPASASGPPAGGAQDFFEAQTYVQRPAPEAWAVAPAPAPEAWAVAPARARESERAAVPRAPSSGAPPASAPPAPAEARPLVVHFGGQGLPALQVRVAVEGAAPVAARAPEAPAEAPAREGLAAGVLLGTLCLVFSMIASGFVALATGGAPSPVALVAVPLSALGLTVTSFAFGYLWGRPRGGPGRAK
ncbi:MAG TPA: globin family protein [Polyangiaceae bacterium]|nr:globin family protein [Polyangiaceae bacterium]